MQEVGSRAKLSEIIEELYNLEPWALRRLAWEALLISDGPDKVDEGVPVETPVKVTFTPKLTVNNKRPARFEISCPEEL